MTPTTITKSKHDSEASQKLLLNFLKVTTVFGVFYVVISYIIDFPHGMVIVGTATCIYVTSIFLHLKKLASYRFITNFYLTGLFFIAVVGCSYFSGGVYSPVSPWFVLIPVIALLLLGASRDTLFWLISAMFIGIVYGVLAFMGKDAPIEYDIATYKAFFESSCWLGLILITYLVSSIFEGNRNTALEVVEEKNLLLTVQQDEIAASNEELHQQKEELASIVEVVQEKNQVIEKQNAEVKSSILYASRIQNALLPMENKIKNYFKDEIFILNKPRDIVSGDFYWFEKLEDCAILVTADCTGHGVPGAFMSMLGIAGLNSIVFQEGVYKADKILNHLHDYIYKSLQQDQSTSSDGMDVSVLVIYDTLPIAEFAGAMNSVYCIQDGELKELKADKKPLGSNHYGKIRNYSKQIIDLSKPTVFYTGSDGYQDQFGGKDDKKFMKKRLKKLALQVHKELFSKQKQVFTSTLETWIKEGQEKQIDDVLLMGFKVDRAK